MSDPQAMPDEDRPILPDEEAEAERTEVPASDAQIPDDEEQERIDDDVVLVPSTDELQEPSTEKEPGEETKAPEKGEPQPSHEAVGIGVIGRPQTDTDETSEH